MIRFALLIWICGSLSATAQTIEVSPSGPILAGDPVTIKLAGLPPKAEIRLDSERLVAEMGQKLLYRAGATFTADADGKLDLEKAVPSAGSYRMADIRGLFWSMTPAKNVTGTVTETNQVLLTARIGGKEVAHTVVQFVNTLAAVKVEAVDGFPGAVFAAIPGKEKRPVVIVLGGSEGGAKTAREVAPNLAARGFAVLGLPYYSPAAWNSAERELPALPQSFVDIPVDRLNLVRSWLQTRSDVDASRIALLGVSKGAEFALIAASKMSWITAVAAIVPSDVVWQGWGPDVVPADSRRSSFSFGGKALPFVPNKDFLQELSGFQSGAEVRYRRPQDKGRAADPAAAVAARIRIENFKGPLLVAGGIEDQMWASGMMAQNIAERRAEKGLETVALIYTDAGHALYGSGWNPTTQYDAGSFKTGGTPSANAAAQAAIMNETLAFLKRSLRMNPSVRSNDALGMN